MKVKVTKEYLSDIIFWLTQYLDLSDYTLAELNGLLTDRIWEMIQNDERNI